MKDIHNNQYGVNNQNRIEQKDGFGKWVPCMEDETFRSYTWPNQACALAALRIFISIQKVGAHEISERSRRREEESRSANFDRIRRFWPASQAHTDSRGRGRRRNQRRLQNDIQAASEEQGQNARNHGRVFSQPHQLAHDDQAPRRQAGKVDRKEDHSRQNAGPKSSVRAGHSGPPHLRGLEHCGVPGIKLWFRNRFKGWQCPRCGIFIPPERGKRRKATPKGYATRLYE